MIQVKTSTIIKARKEVVFSYLMEVTNRPEIIPLLERVIMLDDGPISLGSKYIEVSTIAGRKIETTYQVISYQENEAVSVVTTESIFPIRVDMSLNEPKDHTELTIQLSLKLSGIFALSSPIVKSIVKKQADDILKRVKTSVEALS
jgi:hypothetical protein